MLLDFSVFLVSQIAIGEALYPSYNVVGEYLYNTTTQNGDKELFHVFLHLMPPLFLLCWSELQINYSIFILLWQVCIKAAYFKKNDPLQIHAEGRFVSAHFYRWHHTVVEEFTVSRPYFIDPASCSPDKVYKYFNSIRVTQSCSTNKMKGPPVANHQLP